MSARNKPILCVDFDGVIHSYTSPWTDAATISNPPVPGALQWLAKAIEVFTVQIYSSRSKDDSGRNAMRKYIQLHAGFELGEQHPLSFTPRQLARSYPIEFVAEKPPAFLTIDDRAICFNGDWGALDPAELLKFKPWNKRPTATQQFDPYYSNKPVFEIIDPYGMHIMIMQNGEVTGFDRPVTVINRLPALLLHAARDL